MASPRPSGTMRAARSRARGSASRMTPVQFTKIAKEECEKLMNAVSSIYTPAELEGLQQVQVQEFQPDRLPADDPQRPTPPEPSAPLKDFNRLRMLDGLDGVLNASRGKIDGWLEQLRTKERQEELQELDEWFEHFKHYGADLDHFFRKCEGEVEQGRILCQRSETLVNKLSKETAQTRQEVEDFVDRRLKPMAGAHGAMKAIEKRLWLTKMRHDQAEIVTETTAEKLKDMEQAIAQAKKEFYEERLSRMKMEQAEQDAVLQLQQEIQKRQEELTKLNDETATQAKAARDIEGFVKLGRKCFSDGRPIESKDPEFDELLVKYRDHALNRKRHIRAVVCRRIQELEKEAEENRAATGILRDWTREANAEANTKENVVEVVASQRPASLAKDPKGEGLQTTQSRAKNDLLQMMHSVRSERGRLDEAVKRKKVILEAIGHCEAARNDVRKQLWRGLPKIMDSLQEEKKRLGAQAQIPQLLPSTWLAELEHEWMKEVKPSTELYANILFGMGSEGKVKASEAESMAADTEAIGHELRNLELTLTPAGFEEEEERLNQLAPGWGELDESWLYKEYASESRLNDLRALQQEMFEQARNVAADLTPDAYMLEGVNIAEILGKDIGKDVKNPKKLVRKGTSKKL